MTRGIDRVLILRRVGGGVLRLDASGLATHFFATDPSSIGVGAYDSLAGRTVHDRIEARDITALNRTMRARTPIEAWRAILERPLPSLVAIPGDLDLIATGDHDWQRLRGDELVSDALSEIVGPRRGVSVATKMLHLKRPLLFPVLDSLVAQMLGAAISDDAARSVKVERSTQLVLHLRREGRENLDGLRELQHRLEQTGVRRSLVRILDAVLWLSHPAAGAGVPRLLEVRLLPAE
jgi:hypothetical protein